MNGKIEKAIIIGTFASALTIGTAFAAPTPKAIKAKSGVLLVLSAKSGEIKKTAKGFTLTMKKVDPKVLWFTDRPGRKAGYIPVNKLLKNWSSEFASSQPNAALVHVGMKFTTSGTTHAKAMELSNPTKLNKNTIQWKVTFLKGDSATPIQKGYKIQAPSIFIDASVCYQCLF